MQGEFEFDWQEARPGKSPLRPTDGRPAGELSDYYVDLHVHVGANGRGRPVKITASRRLTVPALIRHAWEQKGLDVIGIIDCACTGVLQDLRQMIDEGELMELPEGGLRHRDRVTVLAGAEVEAAEPDGGVSHHLCYFPYLRNLSEFSRIMARYITNMELSSQRASLTARELQAVVLATGGVLIPAHAFTPHKSVYGNAGRRLGEIFGDGLAEIPAVELGLSSETQLADRIAELTDLTFLSNSDAHSLEKIAREYNLMRLGAPNYREVMLALRREAGRAVVTNFGVNPNLGRYHRSFCLVCEKGVDMAPPVLACPHCGASARKDFVRGVLDRVVEIQDWPEARSPQHRPEYRFQVPLSFIEGLGPKMFRQLVRAFGTEMNVLHKAPREQLISLVGYPVANQILQARVGEGQFLSGAGGRYGRLLARPAQSQLSLFSEAS